MVRKTERGPSPVQIFWILHHLGVYILLSGEDLGLWGHLAVGIPLWAFGCGHLAVLAFQVFGLVVAGIQQPHTWRSGVAISCADLTIRGSLRRRDASLEAQSCIEWKGAGGMVSLEAGS